MKIKNLILPLIISFNYLSADSIGGEIKHPKNFVGVSPSGYAQVSKQLLLSISEELLSEDIAEVDIDPSIFDLNQEEEKSKNRSKKADELDEIEFVNHFR